MNDNRHLDYLEVVGVGIMSVCAWKLVETFMEHKQNQRRIREYGELILVECRSQMNRKGRK